MKTELERAFDLGEIVSCVLVNVSENQTYKVCCADGQQYALRVNRVGYHTLAEINSEMAWLENLQQQKSIHVARPLRGCDGQYLQTVILNGEHRGVILSHWEAGVEPVIGNELSDFTFELGGLSAKLHLHVLQWQRPAWFTRPRWDFQAALGESAPRWGSWKNGIGVDPSLIKVFQRTVDVIRKRLHNYGQNENRFGLVHGDLRLANILVDGKQLTLIDFDDSGFGWFMNDAATMVSFHEHEPQVPDLIENWIEGYREQRALMREDEVEIPTFIMMRRLLLVAWLGSHAEIDLAKHLGSRYSQQTADLCERFLSAR